MVAVEHAVSARAAPSITLTAPRRRSEARREDVIGAGMIHRRSAGSGGPAGLRLTVGGAASAALVAVLLDDGGERIEHVGTERCGMGAHLGHGGGSAPSGPPDARGQLVVRVRDPDDVGTDPAACARCAPPAPDAFGQQPAVPGDEGGRILQGGDRAQLGDGAVVEPVQPARQLEAVLVFRGQPQPRGDTGGEPADAVAVAAVRAGIRVGAERASDGQDGAANGIGLLVVDA